MDEFTIKKAIYQIVKKGSFTDWVLEYRNLTGEHPMGKNKDLVTKVIGELRQQKIITFTLQSSYGTGRFQQGVNFDQLEKMMNPQQNTPSIHIDNFHATNAQVGNQNASMVGATLWDISNQELKEELKRCKEKLWEAQKAMIINFPVAMFLVIGLILAWIVFSGRLWEVASQYTWLLPTIGASTIIPAFLMQNKHKTHGVDIARYKERIAIIEHILRDRS